jgi:integrase
MPSGNVHAVAPNKDMTAADDYLLAEWKRSLLSAGWSPASAHRAANRLRAFSRLTRAGLVRGARQDVIALAQARGEAMGKDLLGLIRAEGWRQDVRTIRAFYRWANNKYGGLARDPTVGIRQLPGRPAGIRIRASDFRLYEAVLNADGLANRDQLIVRLLSHGLLPHEVGGLRTEDIIERSHLAIGRGRQRRLLALSDRAILGLARWLRFRGVQSPYVFPAHDPRKPISASAVRAVVRRAAQMAFPRPDQQRLRGKIYATGFRHLFLFRTIHARVALPCLGPLTGIDRFTRLQPYLSGAGLPADTYKEIARMARRWPGWI